MDSLAKSQSFTEPSLDAVSTSSEDEDEDEEEEAGDRNLDEQTQDLWAKKDSATSPCGWPLVGSLKRETYPNFPAASSREGSEGDQNGGFGCAAEAGVRRLVAQKISKK